MSDFFVAPIVEGHGEVQAVPILLQRMLYDLRADAFLRINPALRVKAGSFLNDHDYFAKYLELAARKAKPHARGSVLILLDSEDYCPAKLGPELAARAAAIRGDVPITVALAFRLPSTTPSNSRRARRTKGRQAPDGRLFWMP